MEIKAVMFAKGVRCGKGSIEELFIDSDVKEAEYTLDYNESNQTVLITNKLHDKEVLVFPTNIAYIYPKKKNAATPRTSKKA